MRKITIFFICTIAFAVNAEASSPSNAQSSTQPKTKPAKKEVRHHEAHVHGQATLNIAFDGLEGRVDFKAAAAGIVGFEHTAKNAKDKAKLAKEVNHFEAHMDQMLQWPADRGCVFSKEKIALEKEAEDHDDHDHHSGEHSDFVASFKVQCKKSISGGAVKIDFTSYPGLKDIDVTILNGNEQKSVEIKQKPETINLQ